LEVGAEGEFKLDLRQDCDPGKQKLKGAVRTETYQHHYCQQFERLYQEEEDHGNSRKVAYSVQLTSIEKSQTMHNFTTCGIF
jgi:hypothetical protein